MTWTNNGTITEITIGTAAGNTYANPIIDSSANLWGQNIANNTIMTILGNFPALLTAVSGNGPTSTTSTASGSNLAGYITVYTAPYSLLSTVMPTYGYTVNQAGLNGAVSITNTSTNTTYSSLYIDDTGTLFGLDNTSGVYSMIGTYFTFVLSEPSGIAPSTELIPTPTLASGVVTPIGAGESSTSSGISTPAAGGLLATVTNITSLTGTPTSTTPSAIIQGGLSYNPANSSSQYNAAMLNATQQATQSYNNAVTSFNSQYTSQYNSITSNYQSQSNTIGQSYQTNVANAQADFSANSASTNTYYTNLITADKTSNGGANGATYQTQWTSALANLQQTLTSALASLQTQYNASIQSLQSQQSQLVSDLNSSSTQTQQNLQQTTATQLSNLATQYSNALQTQWAQSIGTTSPLNPIVPAALSVTPTGASTTITVPTTSVNSLLSQTTPVLTPDSGTLNSPITVNTATGLSGMNDIPNPNPMVVGRAPVGINSSVIPQFLPEDILIILSSSAIAYWIMKPYIDKKKRIKL
jgi:hypothetical protein